MDKNGMEELFGDTTMIEEREEIMVSPTGGVSHKRTAHFLKPNVAAIEGPSLKLPSLSPKCKWPLEVYFHGWKDPPRKWKKWVEIMKFKYQSVWKQAGIDKAIMVSNCKINRNNELIFSVVERWCSETNTFMFPWGEATVTLEDMLVLGGYSVLGAPISLPLQGKELISIEEELERAQKDCSRLNENGYDQWLNLFMESGHQLEHVAFLSMWLSIFVFPGSHQDSVNEQVFPVAIHLARGDRVALAPAVLASIYRDLSLLKETMALATRLSGEEGEGGEGEGEFLKLSVWAPLHLVQIWAWERLVMLQPVPNFIHSSDPRAARWHALEQADTINMRPAIDSAGELFLWRPYALAVGNWSFPKFYVEKEERLLIGEGVNKNKDLESFARCLRVCELLGMDCKELYQPHRVAMQFGYDQDLPKWISRSNSNPEMAWYRYCQPFGDDSFLFLPSRLSESDVTHRYMDWWRKSVSVPVDPIRGMLQQRRSVRRTEVTDEPDVPPAVSPKCSAIKEDKLAVIPQNSSNERHITKVPFKSMKIKTEPEPDVPPGFPPKRKGVQEKLHAFVAELQTCKEEIPLEPDVPPGFPPKVTKAEEHFLSTPVVNLMPNKRHRYEERLPEPDVPPGFPPKKEGAEKNSLFPVVTLMHKMSDSNKESLPSNDNLTLGTQFPDLSPQIAGTKGSELLQKVEEQIMQQKAAGAGGQSNVSAEHVDESGIGKSDSTLTINQTEEQKTSSYTFQQPDLEARIDRIKQFLADLKRHLSS